MTKSKDDKASHVEVIELGRGKGLDGLEEMIRRMVGDKLPGDEIEEAEKYPVPAPYEGAAEFLQRSWSPALGDIVEPRPDLNSLVKFPAPGQRLVVTQVLAEVQHLLAEGHSGTPYEAMRQDIGLAFMTTPRNKPDMKPILVEYLHDSRYFTKVGSIYEDNPPPQDATALETE